jgi:hypothetical protein
MRRTGRSGSRVSSPALLWLFCDAEPVGRGDRAGFGTAFMQLSRDVLQHCSAGGLDNFSDVGICLILSSAQS